MGIIDAIEKLITEHGSAVVLSQQLSFAKDQFADLERRVTELQTQVGRLEALLERERLDHQRSQTDLTRLKEEHAEETRIHRSIEFRRGKRTAGQWSAFCPKCHLPAVPLADHSLIHCSADCGWLVPLGRSLDSVISEL
jgi:hypothetical protein